MIRRWLRVWRDRRRWQERGAAAVALTLVTVGIVLPLGALAVDIGTQRVARRDAQSLADTAALDAARSITSTSTNATVTAVAQTSVSGDRGAVGNGPTTVAKLGYIAPTGTTWTAAQGLGCNGTYTNAYFTAVPAGKTANAVLVVVSNGVSFGLARGMGFSAGGVCRSSIAKLNSPHSCYRADSFALGVDTSNSVLGPVLGLLNANQAVTILSSNGIANADVSLLALASQLGLGTPNALLTSNTTIGQYLVAAATVLSATGGDAADVTALSGALSGVVLPNGVSALNQVMDFQHLLSLGSGSGTGLDAKVGVGDLLTGELMLANQSNAVALSVPAMSVPGVGTFKVYATVVQPPVIGCDGGVASPAQVTLHLKQVSTSGTGILSITSLTGLLISLKNFDVNVSLANVSTWNDTTATCSTSSIAMKVSNQTLANVRITADVSALLGLLPVASLDTGAPSSVTSTATLNVPLNYTTPLQLGSGSLGVDTSNANLVLLGIVNVSSLLQSLKPITDAVSSLVTSALAPLGVVVGGADLYAISPTPTCGGPQLIG